MKTIPSSIADNMARDLRDRVAMRERQESGSRLEWAKDTLLPAIQGLAPGALLQVFVFGSVAHGTAGSRSDVDVLVIGEGFADWDFWRRQQWGIRVRASTNKRYNVDIFLYTEAEAENLDGHRKRFVEDARREGVAIYG
ncbi:MAG: nucleotidyltransferase domain-containing protein [Acidiferrobacter sp.]